MTMDSNIVKFPYSVSRRAHARRPRTSINGTPEERRAKAAPTEIKIPPTPQPTPGEIRCGVPRRDYSRIGELPVARSLGDRSYWRTALARASQRGGEGALFSERVRASGGAAYDGLLVMKRRRRSVRKRNRQRLAAHARRLRRKNGALAQVRGRSPAGSRRRVFVGF